MEYSKKFFFTIAILLPAMIAGAQEKNKMTHEMTEFYSPEVPVVTPGSSYFFLVRQQSWLAGEWR